MLHAKRILVGDTSNYLAGLTAAMLRNVGAKVVVVATDSAAVLLELHRAAFDVLVLDDQMQPIDGIALTRQIRAEPGERHRIPIIMVCVEADRSRIEEARDAGVNEFIKKPMSAKILEARINQTMDNPRGFVASQAYTGPDRRRHDAGERPVERRQKTAD